MRPIFIVLMLVVAASGMSSDCFYEFSAPKSTCGAGRAVCAFFCELCERPELSMGLSSIEICKSQGNWTDDTLSALLANALTNVSALHGYRWMDDAGDVEQGAAGSLAHLIRYMPARDVIAFFADPLRMLEFFFDHVRYAYLARRTFPFAANVSQALFLDYVLPYAVVDEKRDFWWPWRPRLFEAFAQVQPLLQTNSTTEAVHYLTALLPSLQMQGVLSYTDTGVVAGPPVSWRSESSPALLSPQQTVRFGSSCTGTAILLIAACRTVGIPARIAGCSDSIVEGDDHHWVEFYDPTTISPFGDHWHTREGVSRGASDGPWDAPSGPMAGCLQGVVARDKLHTIWSSSWSSPVYLPLLWSADLYSQQWAFVGGENRCGAYCTAWGCGPNRDKHWLQAECAP